MEGARAARAAGRHRAPRGALRGGRRTAPITSRRCGFTVAEYDPAAALAIGDASLTFRELVHPGTSHAIRIEAGGGALVFSGDTALTPALGEHAAGADLLLSEATALPASAVHLPAVHAGRIAREGGCKTLVLTHVDVRERAAALRQAREAFGGPVLARRAGPAHRRLSER